MSRTHLRWNKVFHVTKRSKKLPSSIAWRLLCTSSFQFSRITSKLFFEMVGTPMLMWSFTLIYLHLKWGQFEGKVPQSVIFSLIILYTPDFPDLCTSQNPQNSPKPFPPSGEMKSSSGPPSAFTRSGVRTSIKSRPPKRQRCEISKIIKHHPFHEICFIFSIPKHCKHGNTPLPYLSFDFKWCFKVVVLGLSLSLHTPIKNLLRGWSHPSWPNCLHPTRLASWGVSHHQPQAKLIWENSRMVEPSPGVLKVPKIEISACWSQCTTLISRIIQDISPGKVSAFHLSRNHPCQRRDATIGF